VRALVAQALLCEPTTAKAGPFVEIAPIVLLSPAAKRLRSLEPFERETSSRAAVTAL
jgi:hypothetical protein